MDKSLPARPSLEQLKKLAKDLVKAHEEKQPAALALIREHLPAAAGKPDEELARYLFALHDAQSVIARQHGFANWNALREAVENPAMTAWEPEAPAEVQRVLNTALEARGKMDYALFSTVSSGQFLAYVTKERFEQVSERLAPFFAADYRVTYMGAVKSTGHPVHFWRLWVPAWDSDLLIRMTLNDAGKISGLLYSPPWDSAVGKK
ncbi:MAG TPA: hypothetical protein VHY09_03130 [Candidatus Methylacidiphilales bacterium]|nr:hypothetical protein [Candidatus Methylacidiphilales bacterium]